MTERVDALWIERVEGGFVVRPCEPEAVATWPTRVVDNPAQLGDLVEKLMRGDDGPVKSAPEPAGFGKGAI